MNGESKAWKAYTILKEVYSTFGVHLIVFLDNTYFAACFNLLIQRCNIWYVHSGLHLYRAPACFYPRSEWDRLCPGLHLANNCPFSTQFNHYLFWEAFLNSLVEKHRYHQGCLRNPICTVLSEFLSQCHVMFIYLSELLSSRAFVFFILYVQPTERCMSQYFLHISKVLLTPVVFTVISWMLKWNV